MAALRFEVSADDRATLTRLGHHTLSARLHTWHTTVETFLRADGSGYVVIRQEGRDGQRIEIEAES